MCVCHRMARQGSWHSCHDSVQGFFIYSVCTRTRHCIIALRKSTLCHCGCRSWCTLYIVWRVLLWTSEAMSEGRYPTRGPCGPFGASDTTRDALAGRPFGWKAALVIIKADLAEFASSVGTPSTAHATHPCFMCYSSKADLYKVDGFSPVEFPHVLKHATDYDEHCRRA